MSDFGGFLGGDGWSLDAGDTGDQDSSSSTGSFGNHAVNYNSGTSPVVLIAVLVAVVFLVRR